MNRFSASEMDTVDASVDWYLSELELQLEELSRELGREPAIPRPLFFADLLRILRELKVSPVDFFARVARRWQRYRPPLN